MRLWVKNNKLSLLGSLLIGFVVAYITSLYYIAPVSAITAQRDPHQEAVASTGSKSSFFPDDNSYWKGRVDEKLENLIKGQDEVNKKLEALNLSITEIKIGAAKQGSIYGGIASLIVIFASLLGKGLVRSIKKDKV
jgi:hypothetical protein